MMAELNRCETLTRFCEAAAWSVDLQTVYKNIVDSGVDILNCDGAHLHLLTADGGYFVCHASHSDTQFIDKWKGVLPTSVGRLRWMIHSRRPILMDYERPNITDQTPPEALAFGYQSAVSIPLSGGGAKFLACIRSCTNESSLGPKKIRSSSLKSGASSA